MESAAQPPVDSADEASTARPPGWYPTDDVAGSVRWWDGDHWSEGVAVRRPCGRSGRRPTTRGADIVIAIAVGVATFLLLLMVMAFAALNGSEGFKDMTIGGLCVTALIVAVPVSLISYGGRRRKRG